MHNDQRHSRVSQENNQAFVSKPQPGFDLMSLEIDLAKQDGLLKEKIFLEKIRQLLAKEQRSRLENECLQKKFNYIQTESQINRLENERLREENDDLRQENGDLKEENEKLNNELEELKCCAFWGDPDRSTEDYLYEYDREED